jgi:uncharacterized membrane protein
MKNSLKLDRVLKKPEVIFLAVGLLVGLLFCVFIPYGAGFDEEAHTIRFFDISGLHMIPNRGVENGDYSLSEFYTLSYQRRYFETSAIDQFEAKTFLTKANWQSMVDGSTRSAYFPLLYFPQAMIAGIFWRVFDWPILPGILAMRIFGLLIYLFLCFLTIRNLPFGKFVFLVLALTPMALFEASTINTDLITNAVSFLFIGFVLKVYTQKETPIDNKKMWLIALLTVLVGCVKPGTFFVLLLLFLFIRKKFASKKAPYVIIGSAVISVLITIIWAFIAVANYHDHTTDKTLMSQLFLVVNNLSDFIPGFIKGFILSLGSDYKDWVGAYGYWAGNVPVLTYILFPLALVLAVLCEARNKLLSTRGRIAVFAIGVICLFGIGSFQFVMGYQPGVVAAGAMGRYFTPFTPILFLALAGIFNLPESSQKIVGWTSLVLIIATVANFGYGIYRTYYTKCVYAVSPSQPCTLPVYKNIDLTTPYIAPVTAQTQVRQSFTSQCTEINSVKVRIQTAQGIAQDTLTLSVLDETQKVLSTMEYPLSSLKANEVIDLPVKYKVPKGEPTLWIQASVNSPGGHPAEVGLLGRQGAQIYPDGVLLFNQQEQDADLFFQYTCADQ